MLHVVATPVGNLGDLTPRARDAFTSADVIACEDTRRTWALLSAHHITRPKMISYRQGREEQAGQQILKELEAGREVVLCSDGGYPGISDPGYRLVRQAIEADIPFDVLPGACAVDLALVYSGLPTSSYTFKGFPPRKPGALRRFFEDEKEAPHTLVVYESPFRVGHTLKAALEVLGNRQAAVCIELTKQFERVSRGWLADLAAEYDGKTVKGEVALVIAGSNPKFARADTDESDGEP